MAMLSICFCFFRILVELTCVTDTSFDRGNIWCIDILLGKSFPSDFSEPLMVLDILRTTMEISQSLSQVGCDETLKQILGVRMNIRRILYSALENVLVDFHGRPTIPEWGEATKHLEDQYPQRPPAKMSERSAPAKVFYLPVDRLVVSFARHNFWSQIVWRSTQRPCNVWDLLGEPKIRNLEMSMPVEQQVFWLQIPVDDLLRVEVFQCEGDLGSIEFCYRVRESLSCELVTLKLIAP
jgi:hypothetical protein